MKGKSFVKAISERCAVDVGGVLMLTFGNSDVMLFIDDVIVSELASL